MAHRVTVECPKCHERKTLPTEKAQMSGQYCPKCGALMLWTAQPKVEGYLAVLEAGNGGDFPSNWLLGGVKVAVMGPYSTRKAAEGVCETSRETNEQAGRKVARAYVKTGQYPANQIIGPIGGRTRRSSRSAKRGSPRLSR